MRLLRQMPIAKFESEVKENQLLANESCISGASIYSSYRVLTETMYKR